MFPTKSCNSCILVPVGNLNVELMNIVHIWGRGGSGQVRLFVGNRGSGWVNVLPGRVGSKKSDPWTTLTRIKSVWISISVYIISRYRGRNSTTTEEFSKFQHIFSNPQLLMPGGASGHQKLAPIPIPMVTGPKVLSINSKFPQKLVVYPGVNIQP